METNEPTKSEIKNIHLLSSLDEATLKKLGTSASMHKRYASIFFKVLKFDGRECTIQVRQEKSFYKKYADTKRLVEIGHETFDGLSPDVTVIVHPIPYVEPVTDVVTPAWIISQMNEKHIRLKDIVTETGIDKTQMSANISGDRELSQPVKAMFYYYFLSKPKALSHFDNAKELHKRHARIYFDVVSETDNELTINVVQKKSPHDNHATSERLEEIGRELYALKEGFDKKLTVQTMPYNETKDTFTHMGVKDGFNVYQTNEPVKQSDPITFKDGPYSKDAMA